MLTSEAPVTTERSYFTIVQYVPDPVADERVNIGVIAVSGDRIKGRFVKNWTRIRTFGGEDLDFLKGFAARVGSWTPAEPPIPGLDTEIRLTEDGLREIAGSWSNSIQFTDLRASILPPEQLLNELAGKFLRETARARATYRDRRMAGRLAYARIEEAVREVVGSKSKDIVKRNPLVKGNLDSHHFDVGLMNGTIRLAAHGLSFEGPATRDLQKEVDATAWAVDDVREADPRIPLAIVAIPPRSSKSKAYDKALRIFEGLDATIVEESRTHEWAKDIAAQTAKELV